MGRKGRVEIRVREGVENLGTSRERELKETGYRAVD